MSCYSFLVVVVAMIATAPDERTAIQAARVAQNKAIAAGDLDRAAGFWTEDVTVRRALGQPLAGCRYSAQWVKRGDQWLIRSEVFVALTCTSGGCESAAVP
jgi:hypothetical protein